MTGISENRALTPAEYAVTRWLLEDAGGEAARYLEDLENVRVISRCGCGCASIDFAMGGQKSAAEGGMQILTDYQWRDSDGNLGGVFIFARGGMLAGLEVWSIDGMAATDRLPSVEALEPIRSGPPR
jgi:hypothetical protein